MVAKASTLAGPFVIATNRSIDDEADYEKAISATGYGLFNILLLLAAVPVSWAGIFDTTSVAFILPAVECDFELTLFRKGVLVSIVYAGIIVSGILWDFVIREYIMARYGKRTILLAGLLVDSICNVASVFAKSYYLFLTLKFTAGLVSGGPFTIINPYLSEFHAKYYQARFARWSGLLFASGLIIPAALAISVLPYYSPFSFALSKHQFCTWQVYLMICSIPSVLALLTICLVPESPKFLISNGHTNEALELFRKMYRVNTGKPADTYPIKALLPQQRLQLPNATAGMNLGLQMRDASSKTKQLLARPYLMSFIITLVLQFGSVLGLHTMRLWVPHLFIILNNFDRNYRSFYPANMTLTMCKMLIPRLDLVNQTSESCTPSYIQAAVYVNSTIIATSAVGFGFLAAFIITTRSRKQTILLAAWLLSIASSFGVNWAQRVPYMLTLCAAIIVTSRIAANVVAAINTEVMPPALRSISANYMTLTGNLASLLGNLIFSALLGVHCLGAFIMIGCTMTVCLILTTFLLPKPAPPEVPNDEPGKF